MYLSKIHIFIIFIFVTLFIFASVLAFLKLGRKSAFGSLLGMLILGPIICYSVLLSIDASSKKASLANIKTDRIMASEQLRVMGQIINTGQMPVLSCTVSFRLINDTPGKKVDGSIFDVKTFDRWKLKNRPKNSYAHELEIKGLIRPKASLAFTKYVPYPAHFGQYRVTTRLHCH